MDFLYAGLGLLLFEALVGLVAVCERLGVRS
jgi:hypothetical protein